jgi:oxaloacetate decarboxylase gamma subunit
VTGSLLNQGFSLLIYGIGVVFTFLTLLVILTSLMSKFILRFFPEAVAEPAAPRRKPAGAQPDAQLITAISAAVHKYRKDHPRKK